MLPAVASERWRAQLLQFAAPMNIHAVLEDSNVTVSGLSPQRVAAEQAPMLPPLSLASPALAQARWRLMLQLLEQTDFGPFPAAAWAPNQGRPNWPTCAALLQTPTEVCQIFGNNSAVSAAT